MSAPRIVAEWASKGGRYVATLYADGARGFHYSGDSCGGWLAAKDEASALVEMETKVKAGYFQPDANVTPMRRTR